MLECESLLSCYLKTKELSLEQEGECDDQCKASLTEQILQMLPEIEVPSLEQAVDLPALRRLISTLNLTKVYFDQDSDRELLLKSVTNAIFTPVFAVLADMTLSDSWPLRQDYRNMLKKVNSFVDRLSPLPLDYLVFLRRYSLSPSVLYCLILKFPSVLDTEYLDKIAIRDQVDFRGRLLGRNNTIKYENHQTNSQLSYLLVHQYSEKEPNTICTAVPNCQTLVSLFFLEARNQVVAMQDHLIKKIESHPSDYAPYASVISAFNSGEMGTYKKYIADDNQFAKDVLLLIKCKQILFPKVSVSTILR